MLQQAHIAAWQRLKSALYSTPALSNPSLPAPWVLTPSLPHYSHSAQRAVLLEERARLLQHGLGEVCCDHAAELAGLGKPEGGQGTQGSTT